MVDFEIKFAESKLQFVMIPGEAGSKTQEILLNKDNKILTEEICSGL